jgi:hypothetical protein
VAAGNTGEDAVPETPDSAVTVRGDVWLTGDHRLLCGDSIQTDAIQKVLAGGLADMVFTVCRLSGTHSGRFPIHPRARPRRIEELPQSR